MNVFTNPYNSTQTWSAQGAIVTWGVGNGNTATLGAGSQIPLMMLNLSMSYQRQIAKFYPVNGDTQGNMTKYNVSGAPQGVLQVGSIYGPTNTGLQAFIEAVAKDCKTDNDTVLLKIQPFGNLKCSSSGGGNTFNNSKNSFLLRGLELESLGMQIQGGEVAVVNMPLTFSFTSLVWDI